jgi:hypothetical protein
MGRWVRLVCLLASLGGAGVLVVHYQTSAVASGYGLSKLMDECENLKERNRILRIELGRAGVPAQVRKSREILNEGEGSGEKQSRGGADAPGIEGNGRAGE